MSYKNLFYMLLCFIVLYVSSCKEKQKSLYDDFFVQLLDSLDKQHDIKNKEIVLGRYQTNPILNEIAYVLSSHSQDKRHPVDEMFGDLSKIITDTLKYNINVSINEYNVKYGTKEYIKKLSREIGLGRVKDTVLLDISNCAFSNENNNIACFYFSLKDDAPTGYFSMIHKEKNMWRIAGIFTIWK